MSYLCSSAFNHLCFIKADPPPLHCYQGAWDGHVPLLVPEAAPIFAVTVGYVHIVQLSAEDIVCGDNHLLLCQHVWLQKAVLLHTLIHLHGFVFNSTIAKNEGKRHFY